jgi:two-component system cell cycle response regulator DivK
VVIALSALAMKADEERSKTAGCDAYIVKPLRYRELYAVMERLLLEPRPHATQPAPESIPQ